jgi:hypothetical protein
MNQMAISTVDKELLAYFTQLNEAQKKSLLELIRTFVRSSKEPGEKVSVEQYNQELDEAMKRVQRGEYTTLAEREKEMETG